MKEHLQKEEEETVGLWALPLQKMLEGTPSEMLENSLLQNMIFITFFIDLYGEMEQLDL